MEQSIKKWWWGSIAAGVVIGGVSLALWKSPEREVNIPATSQAPASNPSEALRGRLSAEAYHILVEKGTERPFSSSLNSEKRPGTYVALDTGEPVFRSEDKFDSGTGWPSFTRPIKPDAIRLVDENDLLGRRTEVLTSSGGHLGHVFADGPPPTGLRYCINGAALGFVPDSPDVQQ